LLYIVNKLLINLNFLVMAKYVYVVKHGQFNPSTDKYEFYNTEIFSSHARAKFYVGNVIECNRGYRRERDYHYNEAIPMELRFGREKLLNYQVDYKWRGENENGQVEVSARMVVEQKPLNEGF